MFFDKAKLFFKTAFVGIKKYIWEILTALLIIISFFVYANKETVIANLVKQQRNRTQSYLDEINRLKLLHEEDIRNKLAIEQRYQDTLLLINQQHQEAIVLLDQHMKDEIRSIITETHNDPNLMASRINSLFNIPIFVAPPIAANNSDIIPPNPF